jgi:hypothetical protein
LDWIEFSSTDAVSPFGVWLPVDRRLEESEMTGLFMFAAIVFLAIMAMLGIAPVYPLQSRKNRESLITLGAGGPITVTGTTGASVNVTALGSMVGVTIGAVVTGTDIVNSPPTTVVAIDNAAHTATLSQAATGVHTGPLVFQNASVNGLNAGNFRLFASSYTPSVNTVLSDLTAIEATFTGYAPIVLAMTQGAVDGTGLPYSQSQLLKFVATDAVTPNQIYGWWVDDGTNVLEVQLFNNNPIPMATAGAELSGVLADSYPTQYGWQPLIPANA